ncbi:MAG: CoA pyrophosphatase [Gammaproteobacteria bacterium]
MTFRNNDQRERIRASLLTRAQALDPAAIENLAAYEQSRGIALPAGFRYPQDLRLSAVLVPIVDRGGTLSVLLTVRTSDTPDHAGEIVFPGGRCAPGENIDETALREAREEIGLERRFVEIAGYMAPMATSTLYLMHTVVAFVTPGFSIRPCAREVAEVFEAPLLLFRDGDHHEELTGDFGYGEMPGLRGVRYEGRLVWGSPLMSLTALANLAAGV